MTDPINLNKIQNFSELASYVNQLKVARIHAGKRKFYNPVEHEKVSINQVVQKLYDCYRERYIDEAWVKEDDISDVNFIINRIRTLDANELLN